MNYLIIKNISCNKIPKIEKLMVMINDKKRTSTGNRFIVCKSVGNGLVKYVSSYEVLKIAKPFIK